MFHRYVPSRYKEVVINENDEPVMVNFMMTPSDDVEGIF